MKDIILNLLDKIRAIRGHIVRLMKPKHGHFLFPIPKQSREPISRMYGFDRGTPVDRYYIESFLEENRDKINGICLEITDPKYLMKYGGNKVTRVDVLDVNLNNEMANIIGDLRDLKEIKSDTYDCLVITQTYVMVDDYEAAIRESFRILKPGGTLLATMPCLSPVWNINNNFWRFTVASAKYVFGKYVKPENLNVKSYGNALSGQAFWVGMSIQDVTKEEMDRNDSYFPVIVAIRAIK